MGLFLNSPRATGGDFLSPVRRFGITYIVTSCNLEQSIIGKSALEPEHQFVREFFDFGVANFSPIEPCHKIIAFFVATFAPERIVRPNQHRFSEIADPKYSPFPEPSFW